MDNKTNKLYKLKLTVIEQIIDNSDLNIYHNASFNSRILSNLKQIEVAEKIDNYKAETLEVLLLLYTYSVNQLRFSATSIKAYQNELISQIKVNCPTILFDAQYEPSETDYIIKLLLQVFNEGLERDNLITTFQDALIMDFIGKNGKEHIELHYKENLLKDLPFSAKKHTNIIIEFLSAYQAKSEFSKINILPKIAPIILSLEKEQHKKYRQKEIVLKKELDINDIELKELRKSLKTIKGRDSRGIQTLLRTTSKNHYTLNEMVDRKANIMITVNAIILTVIIGGSVGLTSNQIPILNITTSLLVLSSFFSIVFSVMAITPNKTQGKFTLEDVKSKKGNLLYFGNFHNMSFKDYEWGMLQKLNDSNYLYNSMIKDLYFLGQILDRKYKLIRLSLISFIIGLASSFISAFVHTYLL